jgi:hypothetical protein
MFNKKAYFAVLMFAGLNATVYAMPPKPTKCPGVDSIKSKEFSYVERGSDGYTVIQNDKYDTSDSWIFGFTSIKSTSSQNALTVAYELLATLYGTPKPQPVESYNVWACLYKTTQGEYGVAITPVSNSVSLNKSIIAAIH